MQAHEACVQRAGVNDARGPAHKSRTHRLLGPHKQAEGWNVLALSNGRWKLPDDQFGAFLEHYVSNLPRFKLGLVVKNSEYFPYIMDVDKSATKGASVGSPMEVLKVVVRALKSVVSFPDGEGSALRCAASGGLERSSKEIRMLFEHRNHANFHVLCPDITVDSRTAVRVREKQLAVLTSKYSEVDLERHRGREGADLQRSAPAGFSEVQGDSRREGQDQEVQGGGGRHRQRLLRAVPDRL